MPGSYSVVKGREDAVFRIQTPGQYAADRGTHGQKFSASTSAPIRQPFVIVPDIPIRTRDAGLRYLQSIPLTGSLSFALSTSRTFKTALNCCTTTWCKATAYYHSSAETASQDAPLSLETQRARWTIWKLCEVATVLRFTSLFGSVLMAVSIIMNPQKMPDTSFGCNIANFGFQGFCSSTSLLKQEL